MVWERGEVALAEYTLCSIYENGRQRGEYCLRAHRCNATISGLHSGSFEAIGLKDRYRVAEKFILSPRSEWTSSDQIRKTKVHMDVKRGHYPVLLGKIKEEGIITYLPFG